MEDILNIINDIIGFMKHISKAIIIMSVFMLIIVLILSLKINSLEKRLNQIENVITIE